MGTFYIRNDGLNSTAVHGFMSSSQRHSTYGKIKNNDLSVGIERHYTTLGYGRAKFLEGGDDLGGDDKRGLIEKG